MMRKLTLMAASCLLAVGSLAAPAAAADGDYPGSPGHGPGSERDWICKTQAPWRCWCFDHQWCRSIVWGPYAYLFKPY